MAPPPPPRLPRKVSINGSVGIIHASSEERRRQKPMARSMQWLQTHGEDPAGSPCYRPFHASCRGIRLPKSVLAEAVEDETSRLRKLTSLTYLSNKLCRVFHRVHRDTIVCEDDEEEAHCPKRTNRDDIVRLSRDGDQLAKVSTTVAPSSTSSLTRSYEPSKEQRWCTNCCKCFQRGLSRYDQYCGLDCKTAHRMRQTA